MKQFNTFNYYFTDSSFRIQHENSRDKSQRHSKNKTTLPGGNENVEEQVTHKNTDEPGAVKDKQTFVEDDNRKGNLITK